MLADICLALLWLFESISHYIWTASTMLWINWEKGYGQTTTVMHQFLGRVVLPSMKNAFSSKSLNSRPSSFSTPSFVSSVINDVTSGDRRLPVWRLVDVAELRRVVDAGVTGSGMGRKQRDRTAACDMLTTSYSRWMLAAVMSLWRHLQNHVTTLLLVRLEVTSVRHILYHTSN